MDRKRVSLAAAGAMLLMVSVAFVGCIGCTNSGGNSSPGHLKMSPQDIDQIERAAILRARSDEAVKQHSNDKSQP